MRILILNWRDIKNPHSGGAEIVTFQHAKAWAKKGHDVTWFTSSFEGSKGSEVIEDVRIVRQGKGAMNLFFAPFFYLRNKKKFDIIVDEIHGLPYFTPLYVSQPKIAFIHEIAGEIWDHMFPFPLNTLGKETEKWYFKIYKNVPFWTDARSTIRDLAEKGIDPKNCTDIPCPIIRPSKKISKVKDKNPSLLFVSRIVKMKGIEDVINAYGIVKKKKGNVNLWIVGGGEKEYIESLKKHIQKKRIKNVKFWGKVTEETKFELMARAKILLHASVKEGWGLVVLESAYAGTPAIVYNVNGLRDIVDNNKTGIILKNNTPEEMASEVLRILEDEKKYLKLQKNAKDKEASFSWPSATKESEELLKKTLNSFTKQSS